MQNGEIAVSVREVYPIPEDDDFFEKFFDSVFFKVAILVLAVFVVSCVAFVVFNSLKKHKKSQN